MTEQWVSPDHASAATHWQTRALRAEAILNALLNDEVVLEAAARAYAGERWWDSLPVDNEQKESHRRATADALEAAIAAALPGEEK